jgi:hypothetical protein
MHKQLAIVIIDEIEQSDNNLFKITEFMGIPCSFVKWNQVANHITHNISNVAISRNSLLHLYNNKELWNLQALFEQNVIKFLLIYAMECDTNLAKALRELTNGKITSILPLKKENQNYQVAKNSGDVTFELSGISIDNITAYNGVTFSVRESDPCSLISIDSQPFFLQANVADCTIFLSGCSELTDIDQIVSREIRLKDYFPALIPPIMFLKIVFGYKCWQNNRHQGCVIIDDPLLKNRYGFVNFKDLLKLMDTHNFCVSVGFIPWNYRRNNAEIVNLFHERSDRLSICIHGNDHTKGEFGATESSIMNAIVRTADERMEKFKTKTGLTFDKVMVFPQGIFSMISVAILKARNYLGAVNFEMIPDDLPANWLTLRDVLSPVVTKFYGFPLFLRRHPWEIDELAIDLFLGRPALIMTHHDSFGEGQAALISNIDRLNNVSNKLKWNCLSEIIKTTYLWKCGDDDSLYIRLFAPETTIHNATNHTKTCMVTKQEPNIKDIETVFLNGQKAHFDFFDGAVSLCFQLKPESSASLKFIYRTSSEINIQTQSILHQLIIAGRRFLSEVRDNYIMTNSRLNNVLKKVRK